MHHKRRVYPCRAYPMNAGALVSLLCPEGDWLVVLIASQLMQQVHKHFIVTIVHHKWQGQVGQREEICGGILDK